MENNKLCVNLIHCGNRSLVNPKDQEQKNIFFMPMGMLPLASVLKEDNINIEIIHSDLEFGKELNEIFDFEHLDAIGFDLHWVNESLSVLETAKTLKSIKPELFCFLGGYSASLFSEELVSEHSYIDAVIKGDGEVPIRELCKVLFETKLKYGELKKDILDNKLKQVSNITWCNADGDVVNLPITYSGSVDIMNNLNFTEFNLLRNWEYYRSASTFLSHFQPASSEPMFLLEVGRGCQYWCTFCGGNTLAQKKISNRGRTKFRSHQSVLKSITEAYNMGFKTFYSCLEDENSDDWYIDLLNYINKEKIDINYVYGCWRLPSEGLVDALSRSCKQVIFEISPESGVEELRYNNKDKRISYSNKELTDFLDYIKSKSNVKLQLFFGYYCVGETKETIIETLKFIVDLIANYRGYIEVAYDNFSTDPGSLIFFNPESYNMDIKVRSLNDYLDHIEHKYIENKGQAADMTLFKPKYISEEEDTLIKHIVTLFNKIFSSYKNTMYYYILIKELDVNILLLIIEELAAEIDPYKHDALDELRIKLEKRFKKYKILDDKLFSILEAEYQNQKKQMHISKPTTALSFNSEIDDLYTEYIEDDWGNSLGTFLEQELNSF